MVGHQFKLEFSNNLEVIATLISEGMGLGILPERVANNSKKPLQRLAEPLATITDELCLVHRADAQNNVVSQKLRHEIKALLTEK